VSTHVAKSLRRLGTYLSVSEEDVQARTICRRINLETTSDNVSYVRFELLFSLGIRNSRFLGAPMHSPHTSLRLWYAYANKSGTRRFGFDSLFELLNDVCRRVARRVGLHSTAYCGRNSCEPNWLLTEFDGCWLFCVGNHPWIQLDSGAGVGLF
jgi:hypothetical protein